MIYGIGVDIVAIKRLESMLARHGEAAHFKLLGPGEHAECLNSKDQARFLAKRFAAKEALGKALGTGLRAPVLLTSIAVTHDIAGKPAFRFAPELAAWLKERGLTTHLSISDERDYAIAHVITEV